MHRSLAVSETANGMNASKKGLVGGFDDEKIIDKYRVFIFFFSIFVHPSSQSSEKNPHKIEYAHIIILREV